jgi:hypothetical protein
MSVFFHSPTYAGNYRLRKFNSKYQQSLPRIKTPKTLTYFQTIIKETLAPKPAGSKSHCRRKLHEDEVKLLGKGRKPGSSPGTEVNGRQTERNERFPFSPPSMR